MLSPAQFYKNSENKLDLSISNLVDNVCVTRGYFNPWE